MSEKPKILIVDDKPENLFALESVLSELDVELIKATNGNDALKATLNHKFALALLDVQMPEMDGYELADLIRKNEKTKYIPIIFLSAVYSDKFHIHKGYKSGALDFLTKPFNPEILIEKSKISLEQYEYKEKLIKLVNELKETNEKLQIEIDGRKKAEEQITASLKERGILLQEIYHRTKNNMQVICSMLHLQSKQTKDEHVLATLKETENRIKAMALVHTKLYESKDLSRINLSSYIESLTSSLLKAYQIDTNNIVLLRDLDDNISVGIDFAIPCGLIINEIIVNSLKYAFPNQKKGKITIALHPTDKEEIELRIADNGVGMPKDFDISNTETIGLEIVFGLVENQLEGKIDLNRENGVEYKIKFKEQGYTERT